MPTSIQIEDTSEVTLINGRLTTLEDNGLANVKRTWTILTGVTTSPGIDRAALIFSDTGTHTDPVVGGTVSNSGLFLWSPSPAGWERISDVPSELARQYAIDAEAAAAVAVAAAAPFITVPLETSAAYFIPTLAQAGAFLRMDHARSAGLVIPSNDHVAFPSGTQFQVERVGPGQAMVLGEQGVTLIARDNLFGTAGPGSVLTVKRAAANVWVVSGDAAKADATLLEGESWNPLDKGPSVTLSNDRLGASVVSAWNTVRATKAIPAFAGGVYWEYTATDVASSTWAGFGVATATAVINTYDFDNRVLYEKGGSTIGCGGATLSTFTNGDVIGVLVKNGKIYFRKNGTWQNSANPVAGTGGFDISGLSGAIYPAFTGNNVTLVSANFGATAFASAAPAGSQSYSPLGMFPLGYMAIPSDFSASYGTATPIARFRAALANPTPRTVAPAPILTFAANATNIGATEIADGKTLELGSGFIRPLFGQSPASGTLYGLKQLHRNGVAATDTSLSVTAIEVVYTGSKIEFCTQARSQRVHLFVDGVKSNLAGYLMPGGDGYRYCLVDFGTAAKRRIRFCVENQNSFGPVRIEAGYALLDPTPIHPCNMLVMGDSFWETDFPNYKIDGIPTKLAEMLGVDNLISAAQGGKGFLAGDNGTGATSGGSTIVNYRGRIDADLTLLPPLDPRWDVILFCASGNDGWYVESGITEAQWRLNYSANVGYCLNAARTAWPNALVMCIGHANGEGSYGNNTLQKDRILAAKCQQYGAIWVHGMLQEMDDLESSLKTGDELGWYHPDGHPNDAGHYGLARMMRNLIRDAVI